MNYDGTPVKAQQSLQPTVEAVQLQTEVEDRKAAVVRWNTKPNVGGLLVTERLSREWSST